MVDDASVEILPPAGATLSRVDAVVAMEEQFHLVRAGLDPASGPMLRVIWFDGAIATQPGWGYRATPPRRCRPAGTRATLRQTLAGAGVGQPRFVVLTDPADAVDAVAEIGLPCVLKPADDSASNDVLLCGTVDQAVEHARRILASA